ncbi:hypothetical protein [Moorena producens]|uniref:hypothetical protein n=1 Tax=Moorena producens TaxID=1155739 RepID=UPI003C70F7F6
MIIFDAIFPTPCSLFPIPFAIVIPHIQPHSWVNKFVNKLVDKFTLFLSIKRLSFIVFL